MAETRSTFNPISKADAAFMSPFLLPAYHLCGKYLLKAVIR